MQILKKLLFTGLIISLLFPSCSVQKRMHIPGFHVEWHLFDSKSGNLKNNNLIADYHLIDKVVLNNIDLSVDYQYFDIPDKLKIIDLVKINDHRANYKLFSNNYIKSQFQNKNCDRIILKNGNEIQAVIIDTINNEIKYKDCGKDENYVFVRNKSEIFMIVYTDGTRKVFTEHEKIPVQVADKKIADKIAEQNSKLEPFALIGFISGIFGFLLLLFTGFPFFLGTIATIFSMIGLSKINEDSKKWHGKGFAIAGLVLGIITILLFWMVVFIILALIL